MCDIHVFFHSVSMMGRFKYQPGCLFAVCYCVLLLMLVCIFSVHCDLEDQDVYLHCVTVNLYFFLFSVHDGVTEGPVCLSALHMMG